MAEIRDFTDLAKQELFRLIDAANQGEPAWWMPIEDLKEEEMVTRFLDISSITEWEDKLREHNYLIIEVKGFTKDRINAIWKDVYECDVKHATTMGERGEQVAELADEFKALANIMDPKRTGGLMVNGEALDFAKYLQKNFNTEREYDNWMKEKCSELANSDKHRIANSVWMDLPQEDKERRLNELYTDLCELMGLTKVDGEMTFMQNTGYAGYVETVGDGNGGVMQVVVIDKEATWDIDRVKQTVIHEVRHVYQQEVYHDYIVREHIEDYKSKNEVVPSMTINDKGTVYKSGDPAPMRHPFTSDATAEAWKNHEYIEPKDDMLGYVSSAREYDAFAFAGVFDDEVSFLRKFPGVDPDAVNPVYPGSWDERLSWESAVELSSTAAAAPSGVGADAPGGAEAAA